MGSVKDGRPSSAITLSDLEIGNENVSQGSPWFPAYRGRDTPGAQLESDSFRSDTTLSNNTDGRGTPDTHSLQRLVDLPVRKSFSPHRKKAAVLASRDTPGAQLESDSFRSETTLSYNTDGRATPDTHSLQRLVPVRKSFTPHRRKAAVLALIVILMITIVALAVVIGTRVNVNADDDNGNTGGVGVPEQTTPGTTRAASDDTIISATTPTTLTSQETPGDTIAQSTQPTSSTPQESTSLSSADVTNEMTTSATSTTQGPLVYNPGTWMAWGSWSDCTQTCGYGVHVRYRECSSTGGYLTHCPGAYVDTKECIITACALYGIWTSWSSWGGCDVSCGGGTQSRMRTCTKASQSDNDCIGSASQQQQCSLWDCPDCSRSCSNGGVLNAGCDLCECSTMPVTGRVVATNAAPVRGAQVFAGSTLGKQVAVTDDSGAFTWSAFCPNSNIAVAKEGYVTTTTVVTTDTSTITLQQIVLPHFTVEPQTKSRLTGQSVTLCCEAEASPDVLYYEWFRNSVLIDQNFYPNGTVFHVESVTTDDAGLYWCRANSPVGSAVTQPVEVSVKGMTDEFCTDAYEQKRVHLPSDCIQPDTNTHSFEVGDCKPKYCKRSDVTSEERTCRDSSLSCCGISDFEIVPVQCTGYKLAVLKVKACGCSDCGYDMAKIAGTVKMYGSNTAVGYARISLKTAHARYASSTGTFDLLLSDDVGRAVITAEDITKPYKRTTKIIDLSEGSTGSIFTTMYIFDATGTIHINPTVSNLFYVAKDPNDANSAIASVTIPEEAFLKDDYLVYTENVTVLIGFLDTKAVDEFDIFPGVLMTVDSEGYERELYTTGAFWIHFLNSDQTSDVMLNKNIQVSRLPNVDGSSQQRVWKLDENSGYWNQMGGETENVFGEIDSTSVTGWYNIGFMSMEESECYFKVRVYENAELQSEVTNSDYQIFQQSVHINDKGVFETYGHTFSPASSCFKTVCNGNGGYIELWTSSINRGSDEYLLGANPAVHHDVGMTFDARTNLNYSLSADGVHLHLKFESSSNGPFYENEASCIASSSSDNHFKFYFEGETTDQFTYRYVYDLSPDINKTLSQEVSKRVWFPNTDHGMEACFIKANINMTRSEQIRVRAVSKGGSNSNITNEILGIRETFINSTETVCLEYKCSGPIDVEFSTSAFDYTKLSVELQSSGTLSCEVVRENQDLLDMPSGYNSGHIGDEDYTAFMPDSSGSHLGIYKSTTTSGNIYSAKSTAYAECQSGRLTDTVSVNPDLGVAVYFYCN